MLTGRPADLIGATRHEQWEDIRRFLTAYAGRAPVSTVCVVGNAPLSADARRAREIDKSDLVIRMNSMTLDADDGSPAVGRSCHVVFLSRSTRLTPWVFHRYRERAYLVPQAGFVQYHPADPIGLLLDKPFWPSDLGAMPLPNSVVKARVNRSLDPGHRPGTLIPTTGMMALFVAHEMFPDAELSCAGFSFIDDHEQTAWSHHSGGYTKVNHLHSLELEARLLREWIHDGSLRVLD